MDNSDNYDPYEVGGPSDSSPSPSGGGGDDSGFSKSLKSVGKSMSQAGTKQISEAADKLASQNRGVASFRKGGRVKKTGLIHAHRGEEVVRPEQADKVRHFLKKDHGRKEADKQDDVRSSTRKADPKKTERKAAPERVEKKEDPKRTMSRNSPKRINTRKMGRHKKGRGM